MADKYLNFLENIISFHGGGGDNDESQGWNITVKVLSIVVILVVTIIFGFIPYFWYIFLT